MAAKKTLKRLVINFYDDKQGKACVEWLDQQDNMGDAIRELIVQAASGNSSQSNDSDPETGKKADFAYQVALQIIANGLQAPTTYHMKSSEPAVGVMKPPGATAFGGTKVTIERDPDGKGNGAAANNLLASLDSF